MAAPNCKASISQALGREITDAEFDKIAGLIRQKQRWLWRTDKATMITLSKTDQLRMAAGEAAAEVASKATKAKQTAAMNVISRAKRIAWLDAQPDALRAATASLGMDSAIGGKAPGTTSVEYEARGIMAVFSSELTDLEDAASGKLLGLIESKEQAKDFNYALWGETGKVQDARMLKAAEAWKRTTTSMRDWFNRAGGDIGDLGDMWHRPQSHDAFRVAGTPKAEWVEFIKKQLDPDMYVNDDGSRTGDADMSDMLSQVYDTITQNGENKRTGATTGRQGSGSRAGRHAESRQLFFRDADSWMAYHDRFGGGDMYGTLFNHLRTMARDIAMIERYGPNSDANARAEIDYAYNKEVTRPIDLAAFDGNAQKAQGAYAKRLDNLKGEKAFADNMLNVVAGIDQGPMNAKWARHGASARAVMVAARLGSAVVSTISDHATIIQTARTLNLTVLKMYRNYLKALNPANPYELLFLRRHGLAIDTMISGFDRFSSEYGGFTSEKIANAVMRASGINVITDVNRRMFSSTMMSAMGYLAKNKAWDQLEASDMKIMRMKGVTPEIYAVWQKAELADDGQGGDGLLSGRTIMDIPDDVVPIHQRELAATKLMAMVLEEQDMAVIAPSARQRVMLMGKGGDAGSAKGEIMRAFLQFKATPFAMMTKHFRRSMSIDLSSGKYGMQYRGRLANMTALFAMSTITGAIAMEIKDIIAGKDPRALWDSDDPQKTAKAWWAAALQGGGLGIFGDFLSSSSNRGGSDFMSTMSGPGIGLLGDTMNFGANIVRDEGETDWGADALRLVKGVTPASTLWYLRPVWSNMVFGQLQDMASPGYLDRMRRRTARETGQDYWWTPGEFTPERAPDLGAAVGE